MRRVCVLAMAGLLACSEHSSTPSGKPARTDARAYRIERESQLLSGPTAVGRVGDYRLDNGVIAVIVNAPKNVVGFALSGGNLVDAARIGGRDNIRQLFLYLDDDFPRQGVYDRIEIAEARGDEAVLVAHGVDSVDPKLVIRHEYHLAAGADYVLLHTEITNTGAKPVEAYELGDVVQWGVCERFFPNIGWARGRVDVPWFAGVGDDASYGYTAASGRLVGPHGSSWSDPIVTTARIEPGATVSYERYFVIGDETGVSGVAQRIHALRGDEVRAIAGSVVDAAGRPIAEAIVEARRNDSPVVRARANAAGGFTMPVPPGKYAMRATSPGRVGEDVEVDATAPVEPLELVMTEPSTALVRVEPAGPAKLIFLGDGDTANPNLGPRYKAAGAGNVVAAIDGVARVPLSPGRYRVIGSRGPEWTIDQATITLGDGESVDVTLKVRRAVDTTGYVAGDFHQHALPSGDSAMALRDRVITNLVEGLEILVSTDHNVFTDYASVLQELGVSDRLAFVVGVEATSETVGHYNAYPVPYTPNKPRNGAPEVAPLSPPEIFRALRKIAPDAVLQVNHPRAMGIGYFGIAGFPEGIDFDFDALEVLNGKRIAESDQVIADWFWLIGHGHRVTAMGNSDSHGVIGDEVGYPRSYLGVGFDDPAKVTDAVVLDAIKTRRDVVATNGPFIRVSHDGASAIGATLTGTVTVDVTVQAAPWVDVKWLEVFRDGESWRKKQIKSGYAESWKLPPGSWYVFFVSGEKTLDPVVPGAVPWALTNPVWVSP